MRNVRRVRPTLPRLDGAFKNYHFNNIAWGKSKDLASPVVNCAAFQEIISYQNTFFQNTIYNYSYLRFVMEFESAWMADFLLCVLPHRDVRRDRREVNDSALRPSRRAAT